MLFYIFYWIYIEKIYVKKIYGYMGLESIILFSF